MAIVVRPNLGTALRARLLTFPEVTALVSSAAGWTDGRTEPRIASQLHDKWKMPTRAVRLRRTGGPIVENDASLGIWRSRVDLICYGGAGHEAVGLLDTVLPALVPTQRAAAGFTAGPCRVALVEPEAELFADVDPATGWPFAWLPLSVLWLGEPVA
jgi:hypothetical protein